MTISKNDETKTVTKRQTAASKKAAEAAEAVKANEVIEDVKAQANEIDQHAENTEPSSMSDSQSLQAEESQHIANGVDPTEDEPASNLGTPLTEDEPMGNVGELVLGAIAATLILQVKNNGARTIDIYTRTPLQANTVTIVKCKDQSQKARIMKKLEQINRFERKKRFEIVGD